MRVHSIFLVSIGILISAFRYGIQYEEKDVVFFMAVFNAAAIGYVMVLMISDVIKSFKKKLNESKIPKHRQSRIEQKIEGLAMTVSWLVFALAGFCYVRFFRSEECNDILSIMALVLSISQREISEYIGKKVYNII